MSGPGIAALAILGPAGLFLAVAIVLRIRERLRHRYSVSELSDLSRDDIDPSWPGIRDTLPGDDEQAPGGGQ
jgi:hypothetical protein